MDQQKQYNQLLSQLNNFPLHLLLNILPFLDIETKNNIQKHATTIQNPTHQRFYNLVLLSTLYQKYILSTDRSVYLNFYNQPAFNQYETNLIGEISTRQPQRYFKIRNSIQQLFQQIKIQLKCFENTQNLIDMIDLQIRDPELPLPKMRKQGIAMHCTSPFQYGLVDLSFQSKTQKNHDFLQDCILDLQQLLQCLQSTLDQVLQQRIKQCEDGKSPLLIMQQCYYHPQILTLQNYTNYLIKSMVPFNVFVCIHALLSGIAQLYYQYIVDQQKQFERFIQFQLRYCIYRSIIVALESSTLSKIIYQAVQRLLEQGRLIIEKRIRQQKLTDDIQLSTMVLMNKKNQLTKQSQCQNDLVPPQNLFKSHSEIKSKRPLQLPQQFDIAMNSRLYLAGTKIWINQTKKIKPINQQNPSPSKSMQTITQQRMNNKSFMKILNKLCYLNILDKIKSEIDQNKHFPPSHEKIPSNSCIPLPDQYIANIFGPPVQQQDDLNQVPALQNSPSLSISQSSSHSPRSIQGSCNTTSYFNKMMRNVGGIQQNSWYVTALMQKILQYRNIQNKIKIQPYRFQKCTDFLYGNISSNTPEKQQQSIPQIQLQSLTRYPSLRSNRLISKSSFISKFTKISQMKAVSNIEELIQDDIGVQQQILIQYNSYLMDLSVNEVNVHWCGHTEQMLMGDHFHQIEQYILKYNQGFLCYLLHLGEQACQKMQIQRAKRDTKSSQKGFNLINKILKNLLQWHLDYMDKGVITKKMLKKVMLISNDWLLKICKRYKIQQSDIQLVKLNLDQTDKIIQHYNQKMWKIPKNVPQDKLKIYQQRKSLRKRDQFFKHQCHKHKTQGKKVQKLEKGDKSEKSQRKRRNTEKICIFHCQE